MRWDLRVRPDLGDGQHYLIVLYNDACLCHSPPSHCQHKSDVALSENEF